jgi:L-malate glycosyltransferase
MVTFRIASRVCVNSRAGQRNLLAGGCPASKIEVIHNGVNLELLDAVAPLPVRDQFGWKEPWPIVGTVSRLVDFKGVDTLLRAVAGLQERQPVYCVIVGDGPQRPALEQLAAQLGLSRQVAFAGFQSPPHGYVKAFDIAVQASRREQGSNSVLEYMACGLPVVATRVGGNPEFVMDGQTGLLVECDDAPGMSDALAALLHDRKTRAAWAAAGAQALSVTIKCRSWLRSLCSCGTMSH